MPTQLWNDINNQTIKVKPPSIHKIALHMCLMYGFDISRVRGKCRVKELVEIRQKIAQEAYDVGYTHREIADYLNRERSTITNYLNRQAA